MNYVLIAAAAFAAGLVNAIAGGGSLITFPALVAIGLPNVTASVTNTVAMCPGYFGATVAQRRDLVGQRARIVRVLPVAALGGALGAVLLVATGDRAFDVIVPFLILIATLLLAFGERIKRALFARSRTPRAERAPDSARNPIERTGLVIVAVVLAATYGGYFGAAMGVMILAALAIGFDDSLIRINALKQTISLVVNVVAAIAFVAMPGSRERIPWTMVPIMMIASLAGGWLGGAIASRVRPAILRWTIVVLGLAVSAVYFVRVLQRLG